MKAKLKGKIINTQRNESGDTEVTIKFDGKTDHKSIDARKMSMTGQFTIKSLVADELKLGSIITINLTDEETAPVE